MLWVSRRFLLFICMSALAGCGHKGINLQQSSLMPRQAAESILVKYFGSEWVKTPYLLSGGPSRCQKGDRKGIKISDLNGAVFVKGYGFTVTDEGEFRLKMGIYCMNSFNVSVHGEQDLRDIGAALRGLGAKIDEIYWAM